MLIENAYDIKFPFVDKCCKANDSIRIRVFTYETGARANTDGYDSCCEWKRVYKTWGVVSNKRKLSGFTFQAAYRNNTLGLPKICSEENVERIDRKILLEYLSHHYKPERMVVAGVGIEHEDFVASVEK